MQLLFWKWLPEVLGPETFPAPLIIERAQTTRCATILCSASHDTEVFKLPRQDPSHAGSQKKGKITYEGHHVMLFQDISTELHRKRKRFDDVKQRLWDLKIDYGIIYPAKLKLLHGGKPRIFADPAGVESFIKELDT